MKLPSPVVRAWQDVQRNFDTIATAVTGLDTRTVRTPWTPLPFAANWGNFDAAHTPGAYRRVGDEIQFRGLVTRTAGLPIAFENIAVMPVGARPPQIGGTDSIQRFVLAAGGSTNQGFCWVQVLPNGSIVMVIVSPAPAEQDYLDICGIRYSTSV